MAIGLKKQIDVKKIFLVLLLSFLAIQLVSWALSEFAGYQIIKGGTMLLLFLVVIFLTTLFSLGRNINQLTWKKDGLFILIVFGLIITAFVALPKYLPMFFSSSSMQFKTSLEEIIQAIVKLSSGGIVPN